MPFFLNANDRCLGGLGAAYLVSIVVMCIGSDVVAQIALDEQNYTRGAIFARLSQVDNPIARSGEAALSQERQSRYGAVFEMLRRTQQTFVNVDYEFMRAQYRDNSQPDDHYWSGESRAQIGNAASFYEMEAVHSVRRILNSASASPLLLDNSQDREIYGFSPLFRTHFGSGANSLGLAYNYSTVSFGDSDNNDSNRNGIDLIYTRYVSPIREIAMRIGQREINYHTNDVLDYEMKSINLEIIAEHRSYDYQVMLGLNTVSPVSQSYGTQNNTVGSFYIRSRMAGNSFKLFAKRSISDSSQGNGNENFFSTDIHYDASAGELAQFVLSNGGFEWHYELLCERCSLLLNVGFENSDSLGQSGDSLRQYFFDLALDYNFSRRLAGSMVVRAEKTHTKVGASNFSDTQTQAFRYALSYQASRILNLRIFYGHEKRATEKIYNDALSGAGILFALRFD